MILISDSNISDRINAKIGNIFVTENHKKNLNKMLYSSYMRKKRQNTPQEAWGSGLEGSAALNLETLENIQQQLQEEILRSVKTEAPEDEQNEDQFYVQPPFPEATEAATHEQNFSNVHEDRRFSSLENNFVNELEVNMDVRNPEKEETKAESAITCKVGLKRKRNVTIVQDEDSIAKRKPSRVRSNAK